MLQSRLRTLNWNIHIYDRNIIFWPYKYTYMIWTHMLYPFQSFQIVPKMIDSDQTKSCILICFMHWVSSTQRVFTGFLRITKPTVLTVMLMIIFWKLNIVKTTSKKTRALIYSMKFLSPEAAVYLYAAKLSFLFVLNPWFFVEMWLSLWNMIGVLSMAKVHLQTG